MNNVAVQMLAILVLLSTQGIAAAQPAGFSNVQGGEISPGNPAGGAEFYSVFIEPPSTQVNAKVSSEVPAAKVTFHTRAWNCFADPISAFRINSAMQEEIEGFQRSINAAPNPVEKSLFLERREKLTQNITFAIFEFTGGDRSKAITTAHDWPLDANFSVQIANCYSRERLKSLRTDIENGVDNAVEAVLKRLREELGNNPLELGDSERIQ
jgi:hypothetical protein